MDVPRDVPMDVPRDAGCLPRLTTRTTNDTINDYDLPRPLIDFPGWSGSRIVCFGTMSFFWPVESNVPHVRKRLDLGPKRLDPGLERINQPKCLQTTKKRKLKKLMKSSQKI